MPHQRLEIENHLSAEDLKARYRACKDAKEARRWHALWLISQGYTPQATAEIVGLQSSWVRQIIHRYNSEGPEGVVDGHRSNPGGPKYRLNSEQQLMLIEVLQNPPTGGGEWTGPKVAAWIEEITGIKTYPQLGWVYLHRLGNKTSRRKQTKSDKLILQNS